MKVAVIGTIDARPAREAAIEFVNRLPIGTSFVNVYAPRDPMIRINGGASLDAIIAVKLSSGRVHYRREFLNAPNCYVAVQASTVLVAEE